MLSVDLRPAIPVSPDSSVGKLFSWRNLDSVIQLSRLEVEALFKQAQTMAAMSGRGRNNGELEKTSLGLITCPQGKPTSDSFIQAARELGCRQIVIDPAAPTADGIDILIVSRPDPECTQIASGNLENGKTRIVRGWSSSENPTEALAILLTIQQKLGRIDNVKLTVIGHGTNPEAASLVLLMSAVTRNPEITIVSPPTESLDFNFAQALQRNGIKFRETNNLSEALVWSDVTCLTTPGENLDYLHHALGLNHPFILTPPPGQNVDLDPQTIAHQQVRNGLLIRMALLASLTK